MEMPKFLQRMWENEVERELREIAEARNVERLKLRITDYKMTLHVAEKEQALCLRQAQEIRTKAEKEALEQIGRAEQIRNNVPKIRSLLERAEADLRVTERTSRKNSTPKFLSV